MRTKPQIVNEIYEIVQGENVMLMIQEVGRRFRRSRGHIENLSVKELEELVPALRKIYGKEKQ